MKYCNVIRNLWVGIDSPFGKGSAHSPICDRASNLILVRLYEDIIFCRIVGQGLNEISKAG